MKKGKSIARLGVNGILSLAAILWLIPQPVTAEPGPQAKIKGRYAFRMTPVKSFSADAPGDPGGLITAPRQDILRVGLFAADGEGNLTGRTLATTDSNTGDTWVITFNWTGHYVVNAEGTGFFSVDDITNAVCTQMTSEHSGETPHPVAAGGLPLLGNIIPCPSDVEGHEDYAFVFSARGGKRIEFIQTDNAGGGAKIFMTGAATGREAFQDHEDEEEEHEAENRGHGRGRDFETEFESDQETEFEVAQQ